MEICLIILRRDSSRFLRGTYCSLPTCIQAPIKFTHFSFILTCVLNNIFSSGNENNSPQLNKLRTFFSFKGAKLFDGSSSSDHKSLLFPSSPKCSDFLSKNFSLVFCSSPSTFCASGPYLWGIKILSWQHNRTGLLADYFVLSNFIVFDQSHQNFNFIFQLLN